MPLALTPESLIVCIFLIKRISSISLFFKFKNLENTIFSNYLRVCPSCHDNIFNHFSMGGEHYIYPVSSHMFPTWMLHLYTSSEVLSHQSILIFSQNPSKSFYVVRRVKMQNKGVISAQKPSPHSIVKAAPGWRSQNALRGSFPSLSSKQTNKELALGCPPTPSLSVPYVLVLFTSHLLLGML